jgi:hypothetical protein
MRATTPEARRHRKKPDEGGLAIERADRRSSMRGTW